MTIKDDIKAIIAENPGGSASEIADYLGRDPRNTRRDIAELRDRGEIVDKPKFTLYQDMFVQGPQIIEADFTELPTPASQSRALIPIGPAQPADSRKEAALRQHARARRRQSDQDAERLPNPFMAALNKLYTGDPFGDETLTAMTEAIKANTAMVARAAQTEAQKWEKQRLADQAFREAEDRRREASRKDAGLQSALRSLSGLDRMEREWEREEARRIPEPETIKQHEEETAPLVDHLKERQRLEAEEEWRSSKVDPENLSPEDELELDELVENYSRRRQHEAEHPEKYETKTFLTIAA